MEATKKPSGEFLQLWLMAVLDEVDANASMLKSQGFAPDQVLVEAVEQARAQTLEITSGWADFHRMFCDSIYSSLLWTAEHLSKERRFAQELIVFKAIETTRLSVVAANLPNQRNVE